MFIRMGNTQETRLVELVARLAHSRGGSKRVVGTLAARDNSRPRDRYVDIEGLRKGFLRQEHSLVHGHTVMIKRMLWAQECIANGTSAQSCL